MQHNFSHAFSQYDAKMCFDDAKAENINLTLKLKIGMTQINPDDGKDTGQFPHYGRKGEKLADIRKWEPAAWKTWKTKFEKDVESFWSGAFSLKNTGFFFLVCADGELLAPHVDCSLDLQIMDNKDASNHHNIEVVRLGKSETFFGSHSRLYDSGDIDAVAKGRDSKNNKIMQKASVHEIGHLLGLGHVAIGSKNCPSTGNTNKAPCYGVTDFEKNSVMGMGMKVRKSNAKPWKDAMDHFSRSKLHERVAKAHRSEVDPLKIGFSLDYWPAEFASFAMTKVPTCS